MGEQSSRLIRGIMSNVSQVASGDVLRFCRAISTFLGAVASTVSTPLSLDKLSRVKQMANK